MTDHRISTSLSQADQQAVLDAINTIRAKLPFLINLTIEERRAAHGFPLWNLLTPEPSR